MEERLNLKVAMELSLPPEFHDRLDELKLKIGDSVNLIINEMQRNLSKNEYMGKEQ